MGPWAQCQPGRWFCALAPGRVCKGGKEAGMPGPRSLGRELHTALVRWEAQLNPGLAWRSKNSWEL